MSEGATAIVLWCACGLAALGLGTLALRSADESVGVRAFAWSVVFSVLAMVCIYSAFAIAAALI